MGQIKNIKLHIVTDIKVKIVKSTNRKAQVYCIMVLCSNIICGAHATCVALTDVNGGNTCRCNDGYEGNGFTGCTKESALSEKWILIIVLIILLFVGIVFVFMFFACRRKLNKKIERARLVTEDEFNGWLDPYNTKWQMMVSSSMKQKPTSAPENIKTFIRGYVGPSGTSGSSSPSENTDSSGGKASGSDFGKKSEKNAGFAP